MDSARYSSIVITNTFDRLMEGSAVLGEENEEKAALYTQLKKLVKDVGLSHPTLEEVFMRVTSKKERKTFQETLAVAAAISD